MIVVEPPRLTRRSIIDPYRYVKEGVAPGEHKIVFYERVAKDSAGFIRKIAVDVYADTYVEWKIDGRLIEKIQRTVIDTDSFSPEAFDPPIIFKKWVKFTFFNNSGATLTPGVLCNGEIVKRAS